MMMLNTHVKMTQSVAIAIAALSIIRAAHAGDLLLHWRFDSPCQFGFVEPDTSGNSNDGLLVWARIRAQGGGEYVPDGGVFGGAGVVRGRGAFFSKVPFTPPPNGRSASGPNPRIRSTARTPSSPSQIPHARSRISISEIVAVGLASTRKLAGQEKVADLIPRRAPT